MRVGLLVYINKIPRKTLNDHPFLAGNLTDSYRHIESSHKGDGTVVDLLGSIRSKT